MFACFRNLTENQWRNVMLPTALAAKEPRKQISTEHKAASSHDLIAEAAYFHAEHRGFVGGDPVADWLAAEAEIKAAPSTGKAGNAH